MIKFQDLNKINNGYLNDFLSDIKIISESGIFLNGKFLNKFENEFSSYCESKYCIGVANGLDALTIILKGYIEIGKLEIGDEVLLPVNTFVATALAIINAGLKPIYCDVNNEYLIDILKLENYITKKCKAIIPVHLYGNTFGISKLVDYSRANNLLIIEDAAQAHGALSSIGKVGNIGDAAAFSFYPGKNLGAWADGGAITTNNLQLAKVCRIIANYGAESKYIHTIKGVNSRLGEIQAAILFRKLKNLDKINAIRAFNAAQYDHKIKNNKIHKPRYHETSHVWHQYVIRTEERNNFLKYLLDNNIESIIHYPYTINKIKFLHQSSIENYPIAEYNARTILSIPIAEHLTIDQINYIIKVINAY